MTGRTVHQLKERIVNFDIDLVVCSEEKDLIITANSRKEVSLHRSLDLQTVWTKLPPECEVERVQKLTWRPDGQAFAIAYGYNEAGGSDEDSVLKALVVVVTVENEELNSTVIDGDVTSLCWCESKITYPVSACVTNYFPEPTPLPSMSCVGVDLRKRKHLSRDKNDKMVNFLVIGSSIGDLKVVVGGFLSCCSLNINSLLGIENRTYWIRNTVISSDIKFIYVFIEKRADNVTLTERDAQVLILDTSKLSLNISQLHLLESRIGKIVTLVDHIKEAQSCLTEVWECLKVAEIASHFNKYGVYFDTTESMAADFCELIVFGVLSSSLEQFLLEGLNCNRVKKIIQSVKEICSNVETLVSGRLKPFLEELLIILGEMTGMAHLEQFKLLGLANNVLLIASNNVRILILKSVEFCMVVQGLEKKCTAFYEWLNLVITQLNSDEINVHDFSKGLTDNNLPLILDYLNSICQISYSYNEPISLFQHLGQYFEDTCLTKPLESSRWQEFLEDKNDLVKAACFIPVSRSLSLATAFKDLYESMSCIGSAPEKAMNSLFSVKNIIGLPDSLDCSVVESCYFTDHQTLVTAFVGNNNAGEFSLVEFLPHNQNYITLQKVLRLGKENDCKCVDVKGYLNKKIFALFEERECSNLFLIQIEKSVIDMINSGCININELQDGVFSWRIPFMPISCLAISNKRKFCVAVGKSKKKIQTFDMGFDEDSIGNIENTK